MELLLNFFYYYVSGISAFEWHSGNCGELAVGHVGQKPRLDVGNKPWEGLEGLEAMSSS